jgi:heme/copper-type cytochrome/quinol oxidase subunit 2
MTINWGALLLVAGVSLAVTVIVVALVAFAMVGFSARENGTEARAILSPAAGTALGYACIVVVGLIVLFGLGIVAKDVLTHLFG